MEGKAGEVWRREDEVSESLADAIGGGTFCVRNGVSIRTSIYVTHQFSAVRMSDTEHTPPSITPTRPVSQDDGDDAMETV